MEWKGVLKEIKELKAKKSGKLFYAYKMNVEGEEKEFTSQIVIPPLAKAEGKIVTVQVIQNDNYVNFDNKSIVKIEEQTQLQKQEEKQVNEEQYGAKLSLVAGVLLQTTIDAKNVFNKTFTDAELKQISPDKKAELICSMGMHLSNNFHR